MSEDEKILLFNEVDGFCPFCGKSLMEKKQSRKYVRQFEIAHIYPLNPSKSECWLQGEEKLSEDVNSIENLIAVCHNCHKKYDTHKTVSDYRKWVKVKKNLIEASKQKLYYSNFKIEEEIKSILEKLNNENIGNEFLELSLTSLAVDQKANKTLTPLVKRSIKYNIVEYFNFIKHELSEMDKLSPRKSELIASEMKSFYLKTFEENQNQDFIYEHMVKWLNKKTENYSEKACEIIIAYFIQDCEVLS